MSPTVRISKQLYSRLEKHARGFDTPEQVIERLLDEKQTENKQQETAVDRPEKPKRKRDVSKYLFNGHEYGKGRLVLAVVQEFVRRRDKTSHKDLLSSWPKHLQGSLGVFAKIDEPELDIDRYFFRDTEQVTLTDCTVAICNQWEKKNIRDFRDAAKDSDFKIVKIDASTPTSEIGNKTNRKKTLRGLVIQMWEEEGEPDWDYSETRNACLEANDELQTRGLNPAKQFREKVEENNEAYIENWVGGCHFEWRTPEWTNK